MKSYQSFCHVAITICRASVFYFGILVVVVFLEYFYSSTIFSIPEACVVKILLGYYLDCFQIQHTFLGGRGFPLCIWNYWPAAESSPRPSRVAPAVTLYSSGDDSLWQLTQLKTKIRGWAEEWAVSPSAEILNLSSVIYLLNCTFLQWKDSLKKIGVDLYQ